MSDSENINKEKTKEIAKLIKRVHDMGVNIGIVVGGGNFFRGRSHQDMEAINADSMGMLGTTMNALALRDAFTKENIPNLVFSPFDFHELIEYHSEEELKKLYKEGTVIVFSGGTGHIGCSTDTAASMKAIMIGADVIIKLTNVDGVYDKDPKTSQDAKKYDSITIDEVIEKNLQVVDMTASILARDNKMPMWVFGLNEENSIVNTVNGKFTGTRVTV